MQNLFWIFMVRVIANHIFHVFLITLHVEVIKDMLFDCFGRDLSLFLFLLSLKSGLFSMLLLWLAICAR